MAIKASAQYTISDIFEEYSVILSNDAHVFRADKDNKAIAGNTSIKIYGYQGSTQISTKVGTISGLPSAGMTATIANNNSTNTTITIAVTTALTSSVANNGTLTIPITVGTKTINKVFSWSKAQTGATGGTGKSIGSITNYYLASSASANVTTSTSGWTTTIQTVTSSKKYLWNYVVTKYTDNTVASTTTPCIIGVYGDKGDKGDKGTSITISKTETVYQVGSSATSKPTGTWTATIPATNGKNKYLWTRVTITYSDGNKTEAYSVSSTMDSITIGGNNLIFKGRGDKKEGFFTNFTMDSTTG